MLQQTGLTLVAIGSGIASTVMELDMLPSHNTTAVLVQGAYPSQCRVESSERIPVRGCRQGLVV